MCLVSSSSELICRRHRHQPSFFPLIDTQNKLCTLTTDIISVLKACFTVLLPCVNPLPPLSITLSHTTSLLISGTGSRGLFHGPCGVGQQRVVRAELDKLDNGRAWRRVAEFDQLTWSLWSVHAIQPTCLCHGPLTLDTLSPPQKQDGIGHPHNIQLQAPS